jgi:hypothetical protein
MDKWDLSGQRADVVPAGEPVWRKANCCASGECVEVTWWDDTTFLRDSKLANSSTLRCTTLEWRSFILGIKAGEFGLG